MYYYNEDNNITELNVTQFMQCIIGLRCITVLNIESIDNAIRSVNQNTLADVSKTYTLLTKQKACMYTNDQTITYQRNINSYYHNMNNRQRGPLCMNINDVNNKNSQHLIHTICLFENLPNLALTTCYYN